MGRISNANPLKVKVIADPGVAGRVPRAKAMRINVVDVPHGGDANVFLGTRAPIQIIEETVEANALNNEPVNVYVDNTAVASGLIPNAEPVRVFPVGRGLKELTFDGAATFIDFPVPIDVGAATRIEAIFSLEDLVANQILFDGNLSSDLRIKAQASTGSITVISRINSLSAPTPEIIVTVGGFHTIAVSWNGVDTGSVSHDGGAESTATTGIANASSLRIGKNAAGTQFLKGILKNVKWWDNEAGTGLPIHHWPIDDDNGTVIRDIGTAVAAPGVLTIGSGSWG